MQNLIRSKSMGIGSINPRTGTRDGNHDGRALYHGWNHGGRSYGPSLIIACLLGGVRVLTSLLEDPHYW